MAASQPFSSQLTGIASAEDLQVVADLTKAVLLCNGVCPALYCRARDFDRAPTDTADQMMMVTRRTAAIGGLAVVGADRVKITCIGHKLQSPIDRGETDAFAVLAKIIVNLLCCSEVMPAGQDLLDSGTLSGPALST
jgi:hypothetical protein